MIRDDWLLRQLAELVDGIAGVRSEIHDRVDLESARGTLDGLAKELSGLSLVSLARLPGPAIGSIAAGLSQARRDALVQILEIAAELAAAQGDAELAARYAARAEELTG